MKKKICGRRILCGSHILIRGAHTLLVLGVPATLLYKETSLKKALVEQEDLVYGCSYILLVLASLICYYVTCLKNPGYLGPKHSKLTSKVDPEDHGDTDEDVSDTTPMMQESDSSGLIEQSVNEGRLKALKQRFRYCDYCEVEQPMRSKHCEDCKQCVRKHDHHCPWLDTCVGEGNHKYFWTFLLLTSVLVIWTFAITWTNFQYEQEWKDWWKTNVVFFINMVILSFGGFTVIGLLGFHTFLMFRGLTTWELVSKERITYLKHLSDDFHPFDEGCFMNMYNFLTVCKYREWECMYDRKVEQNGLV